MTQEILPRVRGLDPDRDSHQELAADAPWTREEIEHAELFEKHFRTGAAYFVQCGEILARARHSLPHGRFINWIENWLPVSPRTARRFMQIAGDVNIRRYLDDSDSKTAHVTVLPADGLLLAELCGLPEDEFTGLIDQGVIHPEMKRGDVKRHRVKAAHATGTGERAPLPEGKFSVILADPPWPFETWSDAGKDRSPENHYPTMTLPEIEMLPVINCAADDAVLLMWVTSDTLPHAAGIMIQWGFEYRSTAFVWVKDGAPGLGYWTRKGAEICLLGVRGKPKRLAADVPEVLTAPRGRHSEKPEEIFWRIERLVSGPYLELFGRKRREGWTVWGNEIGVELPEAGD